MAALFPLIFLLSLLTLTGDVLSDHPSLYHSPTTTFSNYHNMLHNFKIFIYPSSSPNPPLFTTTQESTFYTSLLTSPFLTQNPSHAHLFFLPFPSSTSTRSLARIIKHIRTTFPFWNRTLGADHFYLSSAGVESSSDRNVVELKKNSIQISNFPTSSGLFIPHKDLTLPPFPSVNTTTSFPIQQITDDPANKKSSYMKRFKLTDHQTQLPLIQQITDDPANKKSSYMKLTDHQTNQTQLPLIEQITDDPEHDPAKRKSRKFCLFVYGGSEMTWMVEAMGSGCVPVVVTDRPVQDLPLMDVIDWRKLAVFVGGAKGVKRVLEGITEGEYEGMRESGVAAAQHLRWNAEGEAYDAFHMVVYQLWLRRHTIRYARWVEE